MPPCATVEVGKAAPLCDAAGVGGPRPRNATEGGGHAPVRRRWSGEGRAPPTTPLKEGVAPHAPPSEWGGPRLPTMPPKDGEPPACATARRG